MIGQQNSIDNKYKLIERIGHGATSEVFLVEENESKKEYAAKIMKDILDPNYSGPEPKDVFSQEISILKSFSSPCIINLIDSGKGQLIKDGEQKGIKDYLILDYAKKGELFHYISPLERGIEEKYAKLIFYKILQSVNECHKKGICHRDLKLENILLDADFNPKISDFGFATKIAGENGKGLLTKACGSDYYMPPEMFMKNKKYFGDKVDIFSLGTILIYLVTGKQGFREAKKTDDSYKLIATGSPKFWTKILKINANGISLSKEFKKLFSEMVAANPKHRPSVDEIIDKKEWLKDIRELNDEQKKQLEDEVFKEFSNRERELYEKNHYSVNVQMSSEEIDDIYEYDRGINDSVEYFKRDICPKIIKDNLNMNYCITLKGEMDPVYFMNLLANKIKNGNEDNCTIEPSEKNLKFDVNFSDNGKNEEEEEKEEKEGEEEGEDINALFEELGLGEDEENDSQKITEINSAIQVKLFRSTENEDYLLRFTKKSGSLEDFYKYLNEIRSYVKKLGSA